MRTTPPRLIQWLVVLLTVGACTGQGRAATEIPQPRQVGVDPRHAVVDSPLYMSRVDQGEWIAMCMRELGFSPLVEPVTGGLVVDHGDPTQAQGVQEALGRCFGELAEHMGPFPEETPEHWERVYRAWLWTRQCLRDHDYPVTDPPPLDVFVEQHTTPDSGWHPYDFLPNYETEVGFYGTEPGYEHAWIGYQIEDTCPDNPYFLFEYLDMGS